MTAHLGVDIGGTSIDAVLVDRDGTVLRRHTTDTLHGVDGVLDATRAAVAGLAGLGDGCDAELVRSVASVGVGVPGAVVDGVVSGAQNLGIARMELGALLGEAWGRVPVVDNDVNAAALGAWITCGSAHRSLALLNLGTGLAAGFVLDGRVWHGANGGAGEIGHVSVDPAGPAGQGVPPGSLEMYASGSGVARQADGEPAASVLARADRDPRAAAIRDGLHFGVASAVRLLVLTLDVEVVVLGGGLARLGPRLLDGVRTVVEQWRRQSPLLDAVDLLGRVEVLDPDVPFPAIGAAMRGAGRG